MAGLNGVREGNGQRVPGNHIRSLRLQARRLRDDNVIEALERGRVVHNARCLPDHVGWKRDDFRVHLLVPGWLWDVVRGLRDDEGRKVDRIGRLRDEEIGKWHRESRPGLEHGRSQKNLVGHINDGGCTNHPLGRGVRVSKALCDLDVRKVVLAVT